MTIGVLGGSFDPPHRGHLRLAALAGRVLGVERVLFVPCAGQPLKAAPPSASPFHRAAMVALAIRGRPDWLLCDRELERGGMSYTVETLEALRREHAGIPLVLILGSDSLASLPRWRRYPDLLALASLAVAPRGGDRAAALPPEIPASGVRFLTRRPLEVSSTQIRERLAAGLPLGSLVPRPVQEHIRKHDLYRPLR